MLKVFKSGVFDILVRHIGWAAPMSLKSRNYFSLDESSYLVLISLCCGSLLQFYILSVFYFDNYCLNHIIRLARISINLHD